MTTHLETTQSLLWMRSMPKSPDLDEHAVIIRRKLKPNTYAFFIGIMLKNTGGYIILYTYGDIETMVSPEEVEWALL
jgi:hypothetical protein